MIAHEPSQRVSDTGGIFAWNTRSFHAFLFFNTGVSNGREGRKGVLFWVVDEVLLRMTYSLPLQIGHLLPGVRLPVWPVLCRGCLLAELRRSGRRAHGDRGLRRTGGTSL